LECGIGVGDSDYNGKGKNKKLQQQITAEGVISDHRALIFCQLKDMLDIVENELLKKHLPSVTYMRLDGSTDPRDRQSIVRKFNEDPSIDVLLLTTKVGGLGLNLTGADTVIFVEHDWNPMNDLQAMDRAHRLGQKKVVNVYRLITKHTLEEKIMGLQKFKMNIASTVVNQQNSGLASMDTNQLLDLFDVDEAAAKSTTENSVPERENYVPEDVKSGLSGKEAGAVGELGDLWDEQQYEDEYNLDNFIKTLK
jgi:TATA-binding protein-associated factor